MTRSISAVETKWMSRPDAAELAELAITDLILTRAGEQSLGEVPWGEGY
jgi:hypothetical protein